MAQALLLGSHPGLGVRVAVGGLHRRLDDPRPNAPKELIEAGRELPVSVVDQEGVIDPWSSSYIRAILSCCFTHTSSGRKVGGEAPTLRD